MSDQSTQSPADPGQPNRRKITVSQTGMTLQAGALGTATFLWAFGCLKGHQFYYPDDALALGWAANLGAVAMFLWGKLERKIGMES